MSSINDLDDFKALGPFFRIIEQGLDGLADGEHFFDLLAEDSSLTTSSPPPATRGTSRAARPSQSYTALRQHDRLGPLPRPRRPSRPDHRRRRARLRLTRSGRCDRSSLRQPVHLGAHHQGPQGQSLARLPQPCRGLQRSRVALALETCREPDSPPAVSSFSSTDPATGSRVETSEPGGSRNACNSERRETTRRGNGTLAPTAGSGHDSTSATRVSGYRSRSDG